MNAFRGSTSNYLERASHRANQDLVTLRFPVHMPNGIIHWQPTGIDERTQVRMV